MIEEKQEMDIEEKDHGFQFVPVAYARNDNGPCWYMVQKNIEDYEEAFSYLCENNKAYAFPILTLTGDGEDISITGDDMTGSAVTTPVPEPGVLWQVPLVSGIFLIFPVVWIRNGHYRSSAADSR